MSTPAAKTTKANVYVSLKKTVLDPQGATIHNALHSLGHNAVQGVRQGKFFAIELDGSLPPEKAREEVERIAKEVLTNPVIEEYQISMS